ncbi:MAG: PEP/pyruvate-binding domain-containing protein [Actinomycetota bacterium]
MTGSRTIEEVRVISLDDGSTGADLAGAKGANLARARAAGLPVVDGFVIVPDAARRLVDPASSNGGSAPDDVRAAWGSLSKGGRDPVVVRSSSLAEDTEHSSQAGVFDSVTDVRGWGAFLDAARTVVASADRASSMAGAAPLALLVQKHIDPRRGGVMFTADPVSGRADRLAIAVVDGGPQRLVSGHESGTLLVLDRRARIVEAPRGDSRLGWRERSALVRLARRAEQVFGGPQDIEWAIDHDGELLLLQSRPITTTSARATGPVFGPGPIAETFPDPLRQLEEDLWLVPLREALRVALELTSSAPRRALQQSPIVVSIGGRPAVDLDLLEGGQSRRHGVELLDPRRPLRKLRVAWQIGRLRAGLPGLVDDLVTRIDEELRSVPPLDDVESGDLVVLLERGRDFLRAAHGYELLAGTLSSDGGITGAEVALAALTRARGFANPDAELVASQPAVLALLPPAIGRTPVLPSTDVAARTQRVSHRRPSADVFGLGPREALRLRIRWLHELTARAAWMLGERLTATGPLPDPGAIAHLDLAGVHQIVRGGPMPRSHEARLPTPPLPARFRLSPEGSVVAVNARAGGGVPAGGGRGSGPVEQSSSPSTGSVLVVDALDPRLAPVLSRLAGLVSETGSPLSHLAILAREHGVPTVVGVPDAMRRFRPGTQVLVDGGTGEVRSLATSNGSVEVLK